MDEKHDKHQDEKQAQDKDNSTGGVTVELAGAKYTGTEVDPNEVFT